MYTYTSLQTTVTAEKGKRPRIKTRRVEIHGNKGFKEVTYMSKTNGNGKFRTTRRSRKPLTKREITCIRRLQFMPGLFKSCETALDYE